MQALEISPSAISAVVARAGGECVAPVGMSMAEAEYAVGIALGPHMDAANAQWALLDNSGKFAFLEKGAPMSEESVRVAIRENELSGNCAILGASIIGMWRCKRTKKTRRVVSPEQRAKASAAARAAWQHKKSDLEI